VRSKKRSEPPTPLAADTAEGLAAIVEAAERAAVTVIDDAEKQARRQLDDARAEADRLVGDRLAALSDLTDSLIAQAEAIGDQSQRLVSSLEEAKRGLAAAETPEKSDRRQSPERPPHLIAVAAVDDGPGEAVGTARRPVPACLPRRWRSPVTAARKSRPVCAAASTSRTPPRSWTQSSGRRVRECTRIRPA
jgi:vacuolar-type H+-ATPase subunit H